MGFMRLAEFWTGKRCHFVHLVLVFHWIIESQPQGSTWRAEVKPWGLIFALWAGPFCSPDRRLKSLFWTIFKHKESLAAYFFLRFFSELLRWYVSRPMQVRSPYLHFFLCKLVPKQKGANTYDLEMLAYSSSWPTVRPKMHLAHR